MTLKHISRLSLSLIFILTAASLIRCSVVTSVPAPVAAVTGTDVPTRTRTPSPTPTWTPEPSTTPTLVSTITLPTEIISLENIDQLELLDDRELADKPQEFPLRSMDFTPDGRVVTGVSDTVVYVWDEITGQLITTFDHSVFLWNVAISPNGNLIASGDEEGGIKLWNVNTGEKVYTLTHYSGPSWSLAFSPDSKTLASGALDDTVKLWDLVNGEQTDNLNDVTVFCLAFSPDGKLLAIGSGSEIILWDLISKQPMRILDFDFRDGEWVSGLQGVLFSPDGKMLAAADDSNIAIVWDISSGKKLSTIVGEGTYRKLNAGSLAFSPDGKIIATGNDDGNVIFWNVLADKELKTIGSIGCIPLDLIFQPNAFEIGCSNGTIQLWGLP
jgi:WD40 repeat protein